MSTHSITCYTQVDCAGSAESRIARSIGARDFPGRDHSTFNPVHEPCTGPLTLARAGGESAKQSRCIAPIPETQAGAFLGATSPWREAMRVSQARFASVSSFERENAAEIPRNRQQEFPVPQSPPVSRPLPIHSQPVSPVTQSIEHTSSGPRSNSWSPATNREAQFPQHFLGTSLPQKSPPPGCGEYRQRPQGPTRAWLTQESHGRRRATRQAGTTTTGVTHGPDRQSENARVLPLSSLSASH